MTTSMWFATGAWIVAIASMIPWIWFDLTYESDEPDACWWCGEHKDRDE